MVLLYVCMNIQFILIIIIIKITWSRISFNLMRSCNTYEYLTVNENSFPQESIKRRIFIYFNSYHSLL